jgi:hypothetical protein
VVVILEGEIFVENEEIAVEVTNSLAKVDCVKAGCSLCSKVVLTTTSFFFPFSVVLIPPRIRVVRDDVADFVVDDVVYVVVDVLFIVVVDVVVDDVVLVVVDVVVVVVVVVVVGVVVDDVVLVIVDVVVVAVVIVVVDVVVDVVVVVVVVVVVDDIVWMSLYDTEVISNLGIVVGGSAVGSLKYPR